MVRTTRVAIPAIVIMALRRVYLLPNGGNTWRAIPFAIYLWTPIPSVSSPTDMGAIHSKDC